MGLNPFSQDRMSSKFYPFSSKVSRESYKNWYLKVKMGTSLPYEVNHSLSPLINSRLENRSLCQAASR